MCTHLTRPRGFSLLELLVVISIVAVLAAILLPVAQAVMEKTRETREVQAGRTLIAAYLNYAGDHAGQIMPGYDRSVGSLELPGGKAVSGPTAERYPYRLAPYFSYQMDQTILINNSARQFDPTDTYLVSCFPAMGINYLFMGGDISGAGVMTFPEEVTTQLSMANSSLLVFASAAGDATAPGGSGTDRYDGYCILTPPQMQVPVWNGAPWKAGADPGDYGNVDPRYGGQAVCAFVTGNIRMLSIEDLRDMRLWSHNAIDQNLKDYTVPHANHGGRL
jgi:prepilin-type N-terminal cleavage/methylation domain-containing protein